MLSLSVSEPCHEKWSEMTPAEQGVYCGACSKHVMDFTAMADKDIVEYFQKRKGQSVCGRFRNDQLNRPLLEISPFVLSMNIPLWKKFLAAVFICFSAFIAGCGSGKHDSDFTKLEVPAVTQPPISTPVININKTSLPSANPDNFGVLGNTIALFKERENAYRVPFPDLKKYQEQTSQ